MNFKSLPQLLDFFIEESTCIEYYEQIRWNGNPVCPHCDSEMLFMYSNDDVSNQFTKNKLKVSFV